MKQVLQNLQTGAVVVAEVPDPSPSRGRVLVRVGASLLSAGTESAQVAKARQSLLEKIRAKPQLLRQGFEELRDRGLAVDTSPVTAGPTAQSGQSGNGSP